ncbi:DUF1801 domain-containing protein [Candidatus Woesearchaeota archaeon]|nr:DUF1801 domain-containing protein [Candidatus Woesearchaeota archaeon]
MNMFKQVKAKSIKEYFNMLPKERREPMEFLDRLIRKAAPSLKPIFSDNMLGYGTFACKNYKKEVIDWPIIALANQKNDISVYICAVEDGKYIAEKYKQELGKVTVGKSCIHFKKIEDLHLKTLEKVIKYAEKFPGLVGVGEHHK